MHRHCHVWTISPKSMTPRSAGNPCQDRRKWCPCIRAVQTPLFLKSPWPPEPSLPAHFPLNPSLPRVSHIPST